MFLSIDVEGGQSEEWQQAHEHILSDATPKTHRAHQVFLLGDRSHGRIEGVVCSSQIRLNANLSSLLFRFPAAIHQTNEWEKVPALKHYKCGFWHCPVGSKVGVARGQRSPGEYRVGADSRPCRSLMEFARRWGKMKGSICPPCFRFFPLFLLPLLISEKWSACSQHSLLLLELRWLSQWMMLPRC